jgi:protease I
MKLDGKKVAILVCDGFEQVELTEPRKALEDAGAAVDLISPAAGQAKGWKGMQWGDRFDVDVPMDSAKAADYAALLLPGGVLNADKLRMDPKALKFVKDFFKQSKPVAAICHGPVILIDAGVLKGRTVTSYPAIKADLANAGAIWVDEEVWVDNGLVTSRKPDDIPAFNRKMIEEFAEGVHKFQVAGRELEAPVPMGV